MPTNEQTTPNPAAQDYTGRTLCLYHPNSRGAGSALRLEPRVNRPGEDRYNCFFLEMAAQKQAARRTADAVSYATFDWERKITVKLDFLDICELLSVLEGKAPQAGGARKGLYHANGTGNTLIAFSRDAERGGYYLSFSRKKNGADEPQRIAIGLSETEALGLRCIFQTSLFFITFPMALKTRAARTDAPGPRRAG
ncbi:MAG: hypothetical protein K9N49_06570 [Candidatus Marinimicrobia bacterium]|nr:hypothetical protein [Candidatus Neomarinimicrobiota bacterium]